MSSGRSLGKWETKDCKTTKAFPVCKKYIGLPKEPEVLPKPSDPCPPGWHNGSGLACYKVKCYSCWMLIFHYCLAPILSAMKCVLYTAHVARCGKHSLNSRAVSTDPEWMALMLCSIAVPAWPIGCDSWPWQFPQISCWPSATCLCREILLTGTGLEWSQGDQVAEVYEPNVKFWYI